jgi:O-antigen/teichoic acid export membrane protein
MRTGRSPGCKGRVTPVQQSTSGARIAGDTGAPQRKGPWMAPPVGRNIVINLGGQVVPLFVGLFAIPVLITQLGTDRFGVLTLAWMAVGYFSLFDLGLGRALTQLVAERIGTEDEADVHRLAGTALALMLAFGALGAVLGVALAPWVTHRVLRIPVELQAESQRAFLLLALSLPLVITTAGLRGLLEGLHRFAWVNAIRIPMGIFTFLGPLVVLPFSNSLVAIVGVLIAGRAIGWLAHLICCVKAVPGLRKMTGDVGMVPLLLGFGGWMTVTNIVGPFMTYMDRVLIGAVISAAAVAYYATPYEIITKMWLVPAAILGVLFPAFSAGLRRDRDWVLRTFRRTVALMVLILFPPALGIVLFAGEGLTLWLGVEFARESAPVARWLAVGVFVNSLALVPFTLIQGAGRPDLTAKLHLLELPPYLLGLWWFTTRHGIEGAAAMWTVRATLDAIVLYALVLPFVPGGSAALRQPLAVLSTAVAALALAALPDAMGIKMGYASVMLLAAGAMAWKAWPGQAAAAASVGWSGRP